MSTDETLVIVGAGLAGAKAAETLRDEGFGGRVVLVGEERERPYDRPPLSKEYLQGKSEKEKIYIHAEGWYAGHDIEVRLGSRASEIDRKSHHLILQDGESISYDRLLLATGSSPRHITVPGNDLGGVLYLRRVEDCEAIKSAFETTKRAAIIGAGWIGLETAAAARAADVEVTILETAELPLLRVLGPEMAKIYFNLHATHGVEMRMGVEVAGIIGSDNKVRGVRLADGQEVEADVVIVGVGITPNVALGESAGLNVDNGIVVDDHLASSDPDVFAAGDVANAYYPFLDRHLRLEHWSAALNQGPIAASNMVGRTVQYDHLPYFFSDQYDMGMEYWGYAETGHYDEVIFRGQVESGKFIAFWVRDGRVLAGMNVNVWDVGDAISALIRSEHRIDADRLVDPDIALEDLLAVPSGPKSE